MREGLERRLFRFDTDRWNNPWYGYLGAPVLAMLGVVLGDRLGATGPSEYFVVVLCLVLTMAVGFGGLAVIDMRE